MLIRIDCGRLMSIIQLPLGLLLQVLKLSEYLHLALVLVLGVDRLHVQVVVRGVVVVADGLGWAGFQVQLRLACLIGEI